MSQSPPDPALTAESAESAESSGDPRAERVAAAVRSWQRTLVDLGGRNTLLWFRDLPSGTLDLTTAHPGGVSMLLAGRATRLSDLVREPAALAEARRRARAIRAKALELREERGIAAGFLAIGMATWSVPRAARPPAAPVLLRAITLRPTGVAQEDFELDVADDVEVNPVLREYLRSEQGIELDADAIADLADGSHGFDPYPAYAAVTELCARVPEFTIAPRLVIGTFSYAKLPMVADLALQGEELANHDIVAALAGDEGALESVRLRVPDPVFDEDPEREHLVLDADASQQEAIAAVRAGAHLVIKGPPGTGKSQTIANLIASLAAEGKSTLFVAEKRAAIDAVLDRLDKVGLGSLVLDAYDGVGNKRAMARQFADALDDAAKQKPRDQSRAAGETSNALRDARKRLSAHITALHATREPWGVSAHEVQQAMSELEAKTPTPTSGVRIRGKALQRLDRTGAVELGRRLRDIAGLGAWTPDGDDPWYGARITSTEEAAKALDLSSRLSAGELATVEKSLNEILAESHVPQVNSLTDALRAFTAMEKVHDTLEVFRPEVFDTPLDEFIAATSTPEWRAQHGVEMGALQRWRVRRQARHLLRPGRPPADLHGALVQAAEQRTDWFELVGGGGRPEISPRLDEGLAHIDATMENIGWLEERLQGTAAGGELSTLTFDQMRERLADLAGRPERLSVLPLVTSTIDDLRERGLGDVIDDLATRGVPVEQVGAEVDHIWWASLLQDVTVNDPAYGAHDGNGLRHTVEEFVANDHAHLASSAARVKAAVARRISDVLDDHPAHEALIRAEAGKARRHRSLRDLMPQAGATLTAIKPCWAMSPLVVASTLPPGRWFDVVIFDEASQVQPAQAISAISRARQVVVAGDERQLPPTNFFTVVSDDESAESEALTDGFESVLDVLTAALPTRQLGWHYRSRDERLIAFANRSMYEGALTTFPGTSIGSAVRFEGVDGVGDVHAGAESIETTEAEVQRVVDLVFEHARNHPDESLGVIALGIKHAYRLDDAIRAALPGQPAEVVEFFSDDKPERFFVKNLERVQGDERDAIILSIGYGKTPHGRVLHRFGPLNLEGGERRLNVAITRARQRMTVVSSLTAGDLDPERLKAKGAVMLRDFLAYAEAEGSDAAPQTPTTQGASRSVGDSLKVDLARRLRKEGLTVHEDFGSAEHPIDIAVEDPYHRGRVLVAVETDGPRYAALRSTRERDRLRPEQLSRLGWRHMRVWSTDLFRDPAREIARIVSVAKAAASPPAQGGWDDEVAPGPADEAQQEPESTSEAPEDSTPSTPEPSEDKPATAASDEKPKGKRKRRRAFRKATGGVDQPPSSSTDDTDEGWGEGRGDDSSRRQWLEDQRPPHYE